MVDIRSFPKTQVNYTFNTGNVMKENDHLK